ncbi:hypothetical protein HanIR_Chr06g0273831 [Helianthus annuus]|nr:hypothetical protein HanIR_Chr06g0273831 [Helianthus annuus]
MGNRAALAAGATNERLPRQAEKQGRRLPRARGIHSPDIVTAKNALKVLNTTLCASQLTTITKGYVGVIVTESGKPEFDVSMETNTYSLELWVRILSHPYLE